MSRRIQLNRVIQLKDGQTTLDFEIAFKDWISQLGISEIEQIPDLASLPAATELIQKSAFHHSVFSESGEDRYFLQRVWDVNLPKAAAIMMNPSGASELTGDETVDFLVDYVKQSRLGFGSLAIANTSPVILGSNTNQSHFRHDSVNDDHIGKVLVSVDLVILGWGVNGYKFGVPNMGNT